MSSPAERGDKAPTAVAVLAHHALVEIRRDHDAGRDLPVCNCALVYLGWHPTVQAAKEAWARHVLEVLRAEGLVVLDKQQAETVREGVQDCSALGRKTRSKAIALLSAGEGPK